MAFCQSNTTGFNCEWCRDRFFGDAIAKTCQGKVYIYIYIDVV